MLNSEEELDDFDLGRWSPMEGGEEDDNRNEHGNTGETFENRDWSTGRHDAELWEIFREDDDQAAHQNRSEGGGEEVDDSKIEASSSFTSQSSTRDSFSVSSSVQNAHEEEGIGVSHLSNTHEATWTRTASQSSVSTKSGETVTPSKSRRFHTTPTPADVLLGRGELANTHPGNVRLRTERDKLKDLYKATDRNKRKPIAIELARMVHSWGGAFLEKDPGDTDTWSEANDERAIKKCQHALREKEKKPPKRKPPPKHGYKPPPFRRDGGGPPPPTGGGQVQPV